MSTPPVWQREEIESPCIRICVIHPETRLCTGCHRTIDEITQWARMAPEARRAVMDALPERASRKPGRKGGRAGRISRGS